jgi:hypothetical protein
VPEPAHVLAKSVVHGYEFGMGDYWPIDNLTICMSNYMSNDMLELETMMDGIS